MYNYKKITEEFVELATKTQENLKKHCYNVLKNHYKTKKIFNDKKFLYVKGNIPLMLVAHLDTVHKFLPKNIWCSLDNTIIKSDEGIGGDDRCGVYAILKIISSLDNNKLPSILFTTDEEIGGVGVGVFCKKFANKKLGVNAFIEIDRANRNDVINYIDDNFDLVEKFEQLGYKFNYGSYTDIVDLMETFGISGVNLSSGYYNAHTLNEFVNLEDLMWTIENVIKFINNDSNYSEKYKYIEYKHTKGKTIFDDDWSWDWHDKNNKSYTYVNTTHEKEYCIICGGKHLVDNMEYTEDGYICEDCYRLYADSYVRCDYCGSLVFDDGYGYCNVCGCPIHSEDGVQYNYDEEES